VFVELGHYATTLDRLGEHFDRTRIEVLLLEDLQRDPLGVCRRIFMLLGVDAEFAPDVAYVHNAHRAPRSKSYARLLRRLRSQDNPFKQYAKKVIPPETFHRLGNRLVDLNHGVVFDEEISEPVREALAIYFRTSNEEFARKIDRDLSHWSGMGPTAGGLPTMA
jgi:hypothetical protein